MGIITYTIGLVVLLCGIPFTAVFGRDLHDETRQIDTCVDMMQVLCREAPDGTRGFCQTDGCLSSTTITRCGGDSTNGLNSVKQSFEIEYAKYGATCLTTIERVYCAGMYPTCIQSTNHANLVCSASCTALLSAACPPESYAAVSICSDMNFKASSPPDCVNLTNVDQAYCDYNSGETQKSSSSSSSSSSSVSSSHHTQSTIFYSLKKSIY
jgi:hypothetical protein